ncbi:hypothetical protein WN51_11324 [Melipona quadrifasciata]|uniref:Uncharacterized protein n=1 Tax=Melipona quadrifasciata TaxID=166423 RepID=A0A0N0BK03_9HYME|nr:hypothetical protein WN51_11324 [Melipona quadrifasciata]
MATSTDSQSPLVPRAFHISHNLAPSTYNEDVTLLITCNDPYLGLFPDPRTLTFLPHCKLLSPVSQDTS